jgi:hypothetical protein
MSAAILISSLIRGRFPDLASDIDTHESYREAAAVERIAGEFPNAIPKPAAVARGRRAVSALK